MQSVALDTALSVLHHAMPFKQLQTLSSAWQHNFTQHLKRAHDPGAEMFSASSPQCLSKPLTRSSHPPLSFSHSLNHFLRRCCGERKSTTTESKKKKREKCYVKVKYSPPFFF